MPRKLLHEYPVCLVSRRRRTTVDSSKWPGQTYTSRRKLNNCNLFGQKNLAPATIVSTLFSYSVHRVNASTPAMWSLETNLSPSKWRLRWTDFVFGWSSDLPNSVAFLIMNKGGPGARKPKPGPRGERILILPNLHQIRWIVICTVATLREIKGL